MSKTDADRYLTISQISQMYGIDIYFARAVVVRSGAHRAGGKGAARYRLDAALDAAITAAIRRAKGPLARQYIINAALNNVLSAMGVGRYA